MNNDLDNLREYMREHEEIIHGGSDAEYRRDYEERHGITYHPPTDLVTCYKCFDRVPRSRAVEVSVVKDQVGHLCWSCAANKGLLREGDYEIVDPTMGAERDDCGGV